MRFIIRTLILVCLCVSLLLYGTMYAFLYFEGKEVLTTQLKFLTHKNVTIGEFHLAPPLKIEIKNLDVEGLLKIEKITLSANVFWLLTGDMVFRDINLVKPELNYEKFASPLKDGNAVEGKEGAPRAAIRKKPSYKSLAGFAFRRIGIQDGALNFIDHAAENQPIVIHVKNINLDVTNTYKFLGTYITNFELTGVIPWEGSGEEGRISADGWLNLFKKDMQATLKVEGIDGVYLHPYYANWGIDLKKARIEKAKLAFSSDIRSLNNDLTADCHLELTDIVRKPLGPGETEEKAARVTDAVLDMFKTLNEGRIVLDFTQKTKMDNPVFGFASIKSAVEDTLAKGKKLKGPHAEDVLLFPGKLMEGMVKSGSDLSKAVIVGTFSVVDALKNAVKDSFRKDKENVE